jgi:hypothetical protein
LNDYRYCVGIRILEREALTFVPGLHRRILGEEMPVLLLDSQLTGVDWAIISTSQSTYQASYGQFCRSQLARGSSEGAV